MYFPSYLDRRQRRMSHCLGKACLSSRLRYRWCMADYVHSFKQTKWCLFGGRCHNREWVGNMARSEAQQPSIMVIFAEVRLMMHTPTDGFRGCWGSGFQQRRPRDSTIDVIPLSPANLLTRGAVVVGFVVDFLQGVAIV